MHEGAVGRRTVCCRRGYDAKLFLHRVLHVDVAQHAEAFAFKAAMVLARARSNVVPASVVVKPHMVFLFVRVVGVRRGLPPRAMSC